VEDQTLPSSAQFTHKLLAIACMRDWMLAHRSTNAACIPASWDSAAVLFCCQMDPALPSRALIPLRDCEVPPRNGYCFSVPQAH
jgi:hypothetical protein